MVFPGGLVCLPSDTTFEIYSGCPDMEFASDDDDDDDNDSTSASASEPSGDHHHHQSVIINHTDSIGNVKKSVSSEDGVHFIADEPVGTITVEDNPEGLAEPEVRKQVGWNPDALRALATTAIGHRNRRPGAGFIRRKNRACRINRYLNKGHVVSILRPRI